MSQKTWGGRFEGGTDARVEAFTESISFDRRLYPHDIVASQAHARMLSEVGLLTAAEADSICTALDAIRAEIEAGKMEFSISLEDIHTHIERALIARLGDVVLAFATVAREAADTTSKRNGFRSASGPFPDQRVAGVASYSITSSASASS